MSETWTQIKVQKDKNSLKIIGRAETIDMTKRKINPYKIQDPVVIRSRPVTPEAETDNFSSSPPTTTDIIKF
jgi:hypothetical protein